MKGDIVLTRDVEVVEMNDLGTGLKLTKGNSWNVSTNQTPLSRQPTAWFDSFRQADRPPSKSYNGSYQPTMPPTMPMPDDRHYDLRAANAKTANTALARELKGRHLQMIAFGGSIGAFSWILDSGSFALHFQSCISCLSFSGWLACPHRYPSASRY